MAPSESNLSEYDDRKDVIIRSIFLATANAAKLERFRRLLSDVPVEILAPLDLGFTDSPEEHGSTHLGTAITKAVNWSRSVESLTVASDGGVQIPVLGDRWKSLFTHRATGFNVTDEERAAALMKLLETVPESDRNAQWVESIAVAQMGQLISAWEVTGLKGLLIDQYHLAPSPFRGFWVYGMWFFPQYGKHYWELEEEELQAVGEPWFKIQKFLIDLLQITARS